MPSPFPTISREKFLALWGQYGDSRTWGWYAEQLGVDSRTMQVWVSRNRDELGIPVRYVRATDPSLFPWPHRRREHRNAALCRFLEWEAVAREYGPDALPESARPRWARKRQELISEGLVVTYDPDSGYGTRPGTAEELEVDEDGDRRRFAELLDWV